MDESVLKELGYWLRKEFNTQWGGWAVYEWTITDIDDFAAKQVAKHGDWVLGSEEGFPSILDYKNEGATHVIRCVTGGGFGPYADGNDLYIKLNGSEFELVSEIDTPDFMDGDYDEAKAWMRYIGEPVDY